METIEIEKLAAWSEPKEYNTKFGRKLLRTAPPSDEFRKMFGSSKNPGPAYQQLKDAGVNWGQDKQTGEWQAVWWQPIGAEQAARENAAIAASRATDADVEIPVPDGLAYMPFQRAGIVAMRDRANNLLADEQGLGKTVQAIGLINCDSAIKRVLVVCPASLKVNWRNELARWLTRPLRIGVQNAGEPWCGGSVDVVVLNYDILGRFKEIYAEEWDMLVADEAHFLKSRNAKRTKLLLGASRKSDRAEFPGVRAKRKNLMTGTPVLNKPEEIFTLLQALQPGKWSFKDKVRYCNGTQTRWGWDFSGAAHLDELQNRLRREIMVRRLKKEVLTELPAKRRQVIELPANGDAGLVREEREQFERHEHGLVVLKARAEAAALGDDEAAYKEAVAALRKAYAVAFEEIAKARHDVALAKLDKAIEQVRNTMEETNKVVLFVHHHDVTDRLAAEFAPDGVSVIDGRTANEDRQPIVDAFNSDPSKRVLVLGIRAAGVGLSVKASVEVFIELDWTPGVVAQAEDRCHGIGRGIEGEPLLVQHLVLEGSLDAKMARTIVAKQEVADRALDKGAGLVVGSVPVLTVEAGSVLAETAINPHPGDKNAPKASLGAANGGIEGGLRVSEDLRAHVHDGLRRLAGSDGDYARELNDVGFNKLDCAFGHCLAERERLTDKMVAAGIRLVVKYRRQLGEGYAERLAALRKEAA